MASKGPANIFSHVSGDVGGKITVVMFVTFEHVGGTRAVEIFDSDTLLYNKVVIPILQI